MDLDANDHLADDLFAHFFYFCHFSSAEEDLGHTKADLFHGDNTFADNLLNNLQALSEGGTKQ